MACREDTPWLCGRCGKARSSRTSVTFYLCLLVFMLAFCQVCGVTNSSPSDDSPPEGAVFISEPPATVAFANTVGVLVPCTAYGRPAPVMEWIREDGSAVENVPGLLQVLHNNTLWFTAFRDEEYRTDVHAGRFRCTASNSAGLTVSRQVHVKAVLVNQYKTYALRVNDVFVMEGNAAVFQCSINPYFMREYIRVTSWTYSGKTIATGGRYSVLESGELQVRNVRRNDSYVTYRCVTHNILTKEVKASDQAALYVIDPVNSAPNIEPVLVSVTVNQGSTAQLPCAASGHPLPLYQWTRSGLPIAQGQGRVGQVGGNLVISDTGVRDSGQYVCTASNSLGTSIRTVKLTVRAPLSAYVSPSQQTVDVGNTAIFNCTIYGHPVTSIRWVKDGQSVISDSRVSMPTNRTLLISNVQRHDHGIYQCLISNSEENAQGSGQLSLGMAIPIFSYHFEDQYVRPGSEVNLKCSVSGNPTPAVYWTLDDAPLPLDTRFRVGEWVTSQDDVISYVNISSVMVQDGGQYKCMASNKVGTLTHVGRVNVYGVPYIRPMPSVTAVASEVLVIQCHVTGYPIHTIIWQQGGVTLPTNHRQQVSRDGTLTISDVQRSSDEGEYMCTASNIQGQKASRTVNVKVMEPPRIDSFTFPARKQGDRVSVSCVVSRGDLPIGISWKKDGKPIPPDLGVVIQSTGTYSSMLSIGHATPQHNGNYTCVASNMAAATNHTSPFHVDVPPRWVSEPQDSYVVLGHSVVINCQTAGTPSPTITWKKAKGEDPGDYEAVVFETGDNATGHLQQLSNGSLVIQRAAPSDHGYYLCHSSNGIGSDLSKVVLLTVHIPVQFSSSTPTNYTVQAGKDLTMTCLAQGDRPLSIGWSHNGRSIDPHREARMGVSYFNSLGGRGSRLLLSPALRGDSGFFVCNGQNMFGSDAVMIHVLVQEVPEAPSSVGIKKADSRSAVIAWQAPYDGNSPVLSYIIQFRNITGKWDEKTSNITVGGKIFSVSIPHLHPAVEYRIRVLANNSVGLSPPSREIAVKTGEEVPTGPPQNVRVQPAGSQALVVTWQAPSKEAQNGDIQGYYIGYKKFNTSSPVSYITELVGNSGDTYRGEVEISKLDKFTMYSVHVQAYNKKGAGPRSKDVNVLTLEDVPSQPPQDVQATPLSSQSIMVLWSPPPLFTLHGILQGFKVLYKQVRADEDESDAMTVTSTKLSAALYGLEKYTNYSIQVLAFTRMGEGVRCPPIYIMTQQDIPGRPADIKAVSAGVDSILVTWRPPLHPNGMVITYTLVIRDTTDQLKGSEVRVDLSSSELSYRAEGLDRNHEYSFRVSASTMVGEGEYTHNVLASTVQKVSAQIASFSTSVYSPWRTDVILPCQAVGDPAPKIVWMKRGSVVSQNERMKVFNNGSLWISNVASADAGNYTCRAENVYGADQVTVALLVQAPPSEPSLSIVATTTSSIQVSWRSGSNGGSKIQGFTLYYKREHGNWVETSVGPHNRSFTINDLRCGTRYTIHMQAFNRVGQGHPSKTITAVTNGSAPIMPPQSMLVAKLNATFVVLDLTTWLSGGCPVLSYDIRYKVWGQDVWETVESNITPERKTYRVDLRPATWYVIKVTAHNDAGSTDSVLKFATPTFAGSTIKPMRIIHTNQLALHEKAYVMIPLIGCLVVITVTLVAVLLWWKRRHDRLSYKEENASNLRRDLTAETSLMSEIDKRMNYEPESRDTQYTAAPTAAATTSGRKVPETNEALNNGSDDDSNTNIYATVISALTDDISEHAQRTEQRAEVPNQEQEDDIAILKRQALREDALRNAQTLPVRPTKVTPPASANQGLIPHRCPTADRRNIPTTNADKGIILNPHRYASADRIQSLYSGAPSSYITSPSNRFQQPGQRLSTVSSITTASSNQEELSKAFENADPPGPGSPSDYEQPRGSTASSTPASEAGIKQFTQSPPKPAQLRQANCHVPFYQKGGSYKPLDHTSGNIYEVLPRPMKRPNPASKPVPPKRTSSFRKSNTGSGGMSERGPESVPPSSKYNTCPSDRHNSAPTPYPRQTKDPDNEEHYSTLQKSIEVPPTRPSPLRSNIEPDIPSIDEHCPLVADAGNAGKACPEEDDESVRLLERSYHPVRPSLSDKKESCKKPYTDDFTVV